MRHTKMVDIVNNRLCYTIEPPWATSCTDNAFQLPQKSEPGTKNDVTSDLTVFHQSDKKDGHVYCRG